jgi:hypothetical protein
MRIRFVRCGGVFVVVVAAVLVVTILHRGSTESDEPRFHAFQSSHSPVQSDYA